MGASGVRFVRFSVLLLGGHISTMSRNWLTDVQMSDFSRTGKAGYGYGLGVRIVRFSVLLLGGHR